MMSREPIYELNLEDYSRPRYLPEVKPYYGNPDELLDFMIRLDGNPGTQLRYQETLHAAEEYDQNNELAHTVAGQKIPIFVPVTPISSLETTRQNLYWEYTAYNGSIYPCRASKITMRQSLVKCKAGYALCVKASITDLQVCYPGIGWIRPKSNIKGFPGMVTFCDNTHHMALATQQSYFTLDEYDLAVAKAMDPSAINLSCLVEDILGEG